MNYHSTRDTQRTVSAQEAIFQGLSPDGGLYVPAQVPKIDFEALQRKPYAEVALAVLQPFLPDYAEDFLKQALAASYGDAFGGKAGHVEEVEDDLYALELWHGPTAAFKDYALQFMPKLLVQARAMLGQAGKTQILVATSGDTGKAALEGFKDIDGTGIAVFYPDDGTSEVQRLQMVTQEGNNVAVFAVSGNFDDAQRGVKTAFSSRELTEKLAEKGVSLSSANSINWGRLVPQLVYYATSYLHLCHTGKVAYGTPVDYCVPTGNFGDIMAGWYAKKAGLPIGKLVCASNENKVLSDFFETGVYDARREFHKTSSPSMDILVSSNLERLLYHASGSDASVRAWMQELAETGRYQVDDATLAAIREVFDGGWSDEAAVAATIQRLHGEDNYLCDPHTAVAFHVAAKRQSGRPVVVLSTASPFKFSEKVLRSLGQPVPADPFDAIKALEVFAGQTAPASLTGLQGRPVRFTETIAPGAIGEVALGL